jgi:hypothetical protein
MASIRPNPACPERPYGRHPALVTADRMLDAAVEWGDRLSGPELAALSTAQLALRRIGDIETQRERMTPAESVAIANAKRHARVAGRDVARARHALDVLGDDCPAAGIRVAKARIADESATWAEIAARLGIKGTAAWMSFSRLCAMAEARDESAKDAE